MEKEMEKVAEAWNTLANFYGQQNGIPQEEIDSFLDGLGSYLDFDRFDHWPEILKMILAIERR